ncbi:DNA-binding response regulator, OmpR family, contains REC and winged-helix (wHTH) domain [Rhizobium multihospitium]|uniref:DNA-binding response regulator, OmpR family, contains REC and winged-helix (WHTH) domain n=1 Tax=Rhizobium multihospitium TaxID=410764 RepID=A0A1C3VWG6_9HYPH|nr:DNA-binding response regulator, OmpR family, contains REC and winged-helix (wHTH) domain [Rhizobium multihospitium]
MRDHVAAEGWDIDWVGDLHAAMHAVDTASYSLILLDPGLPDGCGLELLKYLRTRSFVTSAIIISAGNHIDDRQKSHQLAAADYLIKPFGLGELTNRIRTVVSSGCPTSSASSATALGNHPKDAIGTALSPPEYPAVKSTTKVIPRWQWLRSRKAKLTGLLTAMLAAPAAAFGIHLAVLQWNGNFHAVIPGELYRSAQLSPTQIETYVRENGIRSIVNLRGENLKHDWYNQEVKTAQRLGVEHIDFKMSARKIMTPDRADQLVDILRSAPKPILIHCQAGADRTGLVAVIYSQKIAGMSAKAAAEQLSITYGHIGIPYLSKTYAMDESLQNLQEYFGQYD